MSVLENIPEVIALSLIRNLRVGRYVVQDDFRRVAVWESGSGRASGTPVYGTDDVSAAGCQEEEEEELTQRHQQPKATPASKGPLMIPDKAGVLVLPTDKALLRAGTFHIDRQ